MAKNNDNICNSTLIKEWDWEKNKDIEPSYLTLGSGKKVWWKCNKKHSWQASINHRNRGNRCPYCSSRKVLIGFNDLQTINPVLAKEWNYNKNGKLSPNEVTSTSGKKVWWLCCKGHEWQTTIASRNTGIGCPYCSGRFAINGVNDLQTVNPILAKDWNHDKNGELKPNHIMPNSGKKVWWKCERGHEWQATIASRNTGIGCPICSNQKILKGYNDLQTLNPTLASEWNYEKNNELTPDKVSVGTSKKVWWKCKNGHEWKATIASRNTGIGCPICISGQKTSFPEYAIMYYLKKYGIDVIHLYSEKGYELDIYIPSKKIAIEYDGYIWHKNKEKQDISKNSKCKIDEIKLYRIREGLPVLNDSSIDYVVKKNQKDLSIILKQILSEIIKMNIDVDIEKDSVAIENLREFIEKENSFFVSNPKIASEWNYERNCKLRPEYFMSNSKKKVWWKCEKSHEWKTSIVNRNKGNGCPFCSNNKILKGYNDLQTINPTLAKEWNYEKNNGLSPSDIMPNSNKKVWWKCKESHEWLSTPNHRNNGQDCPFCSNNKILDGYNDLQTINPTLAKEWNYEKNNELIPNKVSSNNKKKVWWKCKEGHEWQTSIGSRNRGRGCPYCSGRLAINGINDLQTINPTLAKEWNYEKNNLLTPTDVLSGSHKKVWWKCKNGHEWKASIGSRNIGKSCPICYYNSMKKLKFNKT